jgi:hypothetical protein
VAKTFWGNWSWGATIPGYYWVPLVEGIGSGQVWVNYTEWVSLDFVNSAYQYRKSVTVSWANLAQDDFTNGVSLWVGYMQF